MIIVAERKRLRFASIVILATAIIACSGAYFYAQRFGEPYIPMWGIIKLICALFLMNHTFRSDFNIEKLVIITKISIVIIGLASWSPMLLSNLDWTFLCYLNLGISLLLLAAVKAFNDKGVLIFIFVNLFVQLIFFGAFSLSLESLSIFYSVPINESIIIQTKSPWVVTGVIYLMLGIFTATAFDEQDNFIELLLKKSNIRREFLAVYSHLIIDPIQSIRSNSDRIESILGKSELIEENKLYLDWITKRMDTLLETINTFKNKELVSCSEAKVELEELFGKRLNLITPKNKIVETQFPREILFAIENFARNSIQCSHRPPSVKIEIDGSDLLFIISDEGDGMTVDQLNSLGMPVKSTWGGEGIGMYLSKTLLNSVGYQIKVSSTKGKGTTTTLAPNGTFRASSLEKNSRIL